MGSIYKQKQRLPDGSYRELPTLWIKYYQHGRPVRESTGTTKETKARRILRSREGDVEHGIQIDPKRDRIVVDDALKSVEDDYTINGRKSLDDVKRRITLHLKPFFKARRLSSLTDADVLAFVTHRKDEGAVNGTINRELAVLKRAFRLARLRSRPEIPKLQEANARRGFFEREQFEALRAKLPVELRNLVTFAYLTGWRLKSEILPLEWRQVDWQGRTVKLDPGTTKNRDGRTFPFTAALESLLKEQLVEHERRKKQDGKIVRFVFHRGGERIKSIRGAWKTACTAAGVPGRIVHDFRRTAVRNLERDGVPRSAAMAMVGHKTEAIYRRYAIVDAGMLREAAARIDRAASE